MAGGDDDAVAAERAELGLGRTIPALPVRSVPEAVRFYEGRLGFRALHQDDGFAVKGRDDAIVHLWESADEAWPGRPVPDDGSPVQSGAESFLAGTAGCRIEVRDVDALFAELQAAGVLHPRSNEVTETDFGTREFHALDLDGNLLGFHRWE